MLIYDRCMQLIDARPAAGHSWIHLLVRWLRGTRRQRSTAERERCGC